MKSTFCSNCLGTGHNKRTCREATVNGRRQRARDRARGSSSDLSSAYSSSSQDPEDRREEREAEREYLMEMAEEQGYASDSELSMLASSLFNGMEDIEMNSEVRGSEVGSGEVDKIDGIDSEVVGDYDLGGDSEVLDFPTSGLYRKDVIGSILWRSLYLRVLRSLLVELLDIPIFSDEIALVAAML